MNKHRLHVIAASAALSMAVLAQAADPLNPATILRQLLGW